jgi:hypothetical protein
VDVAAARCMKNMPGGVCVDGGDRVSSVGENLSSMGVFEEESIVSKIGVNLED